MIFLTKYDKNAKTIKSWELINGKLIELKIR